MNVTIHTSARPDKGVDLLLTSLKGETQVTLNQREAIDFAMRILINAGVRQVAIQPDGTWQVGG